MLDLIRNAPRVLDDLAVHVANVETAIRGVREVHHAHPGVLARRKLVALLIVGPAADEARPVGEDFLAVDQLAAGVAGKRVVHEIVAIGVAAKDRRTRGAGEIAADAAAALDDSLDHAANAPPGADDPPGLVGTDPVDLGGAAIRRDALPRRRQGQEGILPRIAVSVDPILQVVGIRAGKLPAVVVKAHAILRAAAFEAEFVGARIKPEIAGAEFDFGQFRAFQILDFAPVATAGLDVDAIVLTPLGAVHQRLHIEPFQAGAETGEYLFTNFRATVAIAVLEPPDVGRRADKDAAVRPDHAGRPRDVVGKDGAGLVDAVAVLVLEHRDPAEVRLDVPHLGIVDHFAHEHPAVFVEGNCDGIAHLGLVGGEFQLEAGLDLPRRNRVFRLDRRVVRQLLRGIEGHGGFRLAVGLPVGVAKLNVVGGEDPASETSKNTKEDSFHSQE